MSDNNKNFSGFTIVELLVSLSVIGILSLAIIGAMMNYFTLITRTNVMVDMALDSQNLLRSTVEELRYGAGVRNSNTITDPNGPGGGWNTSSSNFVIIIATPAQDSSRNYIIDPDTGEPYSNELVYYRQGDKLMKRSLANPDASGNTMLTSCPKQTATSSCPADKELVENLNTMSFTLYDQDDAITTNPQLARSVLITLALEKDTFGQPQTLNNKLRVSLRNKF